MKTGKQPNFWVRKAIVFTVVSLSCVLRICAQQKPRVIQATSHKVSVRDGNIYQKEVWNLSPQIKPDVYQALASATEKRVTFYTDADSISFDVMPGVNYDFVILLNNRDSCYTRISGFQPEVKKSHKDESPVLLPPESLVSDFVLLRQALEKDHAGLYRYKTKLEMDKLFDEALLRLDHQMTQLEFAKIIMKMVSGIKDGHTGTNVPGILMDYYNAGIEVFPFYPWFVNGKAFVLCGQVPGLPAGAEILSVNGLSMNGIEKRIFDYLPSDGSIITKKRQILNDEAFPIMYHWLIGNENTFRISFRKDKGRVETIEVKGKTLKTIECEYQNKTRDKRFLKLEFRSNELAVLTVKSFDVNRIARDNQDFTRFLDESFKKIKAQGVKKLIIDVRGNGGGNDDFGALLYAYLTITPFKYFARKSSTTADVQLSENPLLGLQKPKEDSFTGRVVFLIDGLSFSTTADFCAIAKSNERGVFVGEETGGGYFGNTSGGRKELMLPNSGIRVNIPLFKYENEVKKAKYKDRGIIPDHIIPLSINDVLSSKDAQLDFALKLMGDKNE